MAEALPARRQMVELQMGAIAGHDAGARIGQITVPTLLIHGSEDEMIPLANGELIASLIPGARLEVLAGVGHMFWWKQPERAAELIRSQIEPTYSCGSSSSSSSSSADVSTSFSSSEPDGQYCGESLPSTLKT